MRSSQAAPPLRILILGGSSEASALVRALSDTALGPSRLAAPGTRPIVCILSLAGRTAAPLDLPVATRIGGFGGAAGLAAYLEAEQIDLIVDATHPFAARMSATAWLVGKQTGIPVIRLTRPGWTPQPGDRWLEVADMAAAADALGAPPRRVFLTIGRLQLAAFARAPQHAYLIRTIDPPTEAHGLPHAVFIAGRGPFDVDDEERLMRTHRIDVLVTKNSGGSGSAKLTAAKRLALPVILVARPDEPGGRVESIAEALALIAPHRNAPAPRGV